MRGNKIKIIILSAILLLSIVVQILELITSSCETKINFLSFIALGLSIITFILMYLLDIRENTKKIHLYGSLNLFDTYDRDNIIEEIKENLLKKHIIYINCSNLNFLEVENIKQKIYEYFTLNRCIYKNRKKALTIKNIFLPEKLDFESLNASIFSNRFHNKTHINLYIYDYNNANVHYIKRIQTRLNNINKGDNKNTYIIYLSEFSLEDDIQNSLNYNNIMKLIDPQIPLNDEKSPLNKNIAEEKIENVLIIEKILDNRLYKKIIAANKEYIYIIYNMQIGQYKKALKLIESYQNINNDFYLQFLLADCLHLLNYYYYSYTILFFLKQKFTSDNFLYEEILLKISHILKHVGLFNDTINDNATKDMFEVDSNSILKMIIKSDDVELKIIKNNYLAYLYKKLSGSKKLFNLDNVNLKLFENDLKPENNMYLAAFMAYKEPNKALKLVDESIEYFEKFGDRLRFNAYYVKGEILRLFGKYNDAYEYYIKASGVLENHIDLNLLDQCYFSLKALERLDLVKGIASSQIKNMKTKYFDDNNLRKDINIQEIKNLLHEYRSLHYDTSSEFTLLFNKALINFVDYKSDEALKTILINNIFIIL